MRKLRLAGAVKRYHTVPTIGTQTVAEHSFNLCLLILQLTEGKASAELLKAALYHDLPEVDTGDVPATAKWRAPELNRQLKLLEDTFESTYGTYVHLDEKEKEILKWCDVMELVLYGLDQLNMGNRNLLAVAERGVEYLNDLPSINTMSDLLLRQACYELRDFYAEKP